MGEPLPIALVGPMACGKTTLGRALANVLDRPFVDADEAIEARLGRSIPAIFETEGEGHFRDAERDVIGSLLREASERSPGQAPPVVAMGGGAWLDAGTRASWLREGLVLHVHADAEVCARRIEDPSARPVLDVDTNAAVATERIAERLATLEAIRGPLYRQSHLRIDGSQALDPLLQSLTARIRAHEQAHAGLRLGRFVHDRGATTLAIGRGSGRRIPQWTRALGVTGATAIVHQPRFQARAQELAEAIVAQCGVRACCIEAADGERAKTWNELQRLCTELAAGGVGRDSAVIALGGGALTDAAGLASALHLRGVSLIAVPTTLLAMVDASLGGKTAINTEAGKNTIGTIVMPTVVVLDLDFLDTLEARDHRSGMAEVYKHGLLDPSLWEVLQREAFELDADRLWHAIDVKRRIVERDPYELGPRAWLNLGHTFAHAIERVARSSYRHGEAVAIGLVAALELSRRARGLAPEVLDRTRTQLDAWGLPTSLEGSVDELMHAMIGDKKSARGALRFVLLEAVGRPVVASGMDEEDVRAAWLAVGAR